MILPLPLLFQPPGHCLRSRMVGGSPTEAVRGRDRVVLEEHASAILRKVAGTRDLYGRGVARLTAADSPRQ